MSKGLRGLLAIYLKNGGSSIDNNHGALYSNNLNRQPFSESITTHGTEITFDSSVCIVTLCVLVILDDTSES